MHLAVLDITMPRMTGLQAAREIARRAPDVKVLILSMHDDERYLFEALRAGAAGYVPKSVADRDLVEACRATMRGEPFLYPGAVKALVRDWRDRDGALEAEDPLTPRELEIVKLIAESRTSREIAELLTISEKTVERHRANILEKLEDARPRRADALRDPPRADRALARTAALEGHPRGRMRVIPHGPTAARPPACSDMHATKLPVQALQPPARALVVDDHPAVREGVRAMLDATPGLRCTGWAASVAEAHERAQETRPNVVVLDHHLPDGDGVSLCLQLKTTYPEPGGGPVLGVRRRAPRGARHDRRRRRAREQERRSGRAAGRRTGGGQRFGRAALAVPGGARGGRLAARSGATCRSSACCCTRPRPRRSRARSTPTRRG